MMQRPSAEHAIGPSAGRIRSMPQETRERLMQQQLSLLIHAGTCWRMSRVGKPNNCSDRNCFTIRDLFPHMESCTLGKECNTPHCFSSKQILKHFRTCRNNECPVCIGVRKPNQHNPSIVAAASSESALPSSQYQNGPCAANSAKQKSDMSMLNGLKCSDSPRLESGSHCSTPASGSSAVNGEVMRNNLNDEHITDQQRELAMRKFVNDISLSIFPTADSTALNDPRMKQFLDYVKRMEKDIYLKSKSPDEYYRAMAMHYRSIHSELKEKRRLRGTRPQKPNGDHSEPNSALGIPEQEKTEESPAKVSDNYDQDNFTDALAIVRKRDEQAQMEKAESNSTNSDVPTVNCENVTKGSSVSPTEKVPTSAEENKTANTPEPSVVDNTECKPDTAATSSPDVKAEESRTDNQPSSSRPREPFSPRIWYPNELLSHFMPVIDKISKERDAEPFLQPVDWESLAIYDYPQIVSHPMDLSTIRKKLEDRKYKDPWEVVDDFWLMLNNAWLYNKKTSKVYKTCTRLSEIFESHIDPVMQSLGFCCGREYYYQPPPLTCLTPKFCTIHRDAVYYVYKNEGQIPGLLDQKYTVCERCYNEADEEIRLDSDSSTVVTVRKSLMEKCKNDVKEKEPFVFCKQCGRKWHKVCAIHIDEIWPEGFICNHCVVNYGIKRSENRFTARKLSTCKLSNFLEKRVNDFLKKKEADAGDVIIRVLAAADKTVEVKPGMKARFCESGEMPESFPYRVKAIFAFQEIDGHEVCFFGLHVQEYGSECPQPNTRRVYLAYLDSVYFFRPKQYRTDIYHELLVGYIHYAKLLGFTMAHIWACPPSEGDDYIFHMHPPDQKIPKPKRLQEWYQKMLKKAHFERIVVDYKDIYQDAYESRLVSATELAYFEGDFWPNTLEELFKEMDEEDARRKREQEALARDDDDDDTKENLQTRENDKNPGKKKAKKRKLKRNSLSLPGKRKRLAGSGSTDMANEVARRVYEIMEKHKENFFVIRLHPQNAVSLLPPIKDPDPLINSDLMECRGAFLEQAREKHLEFSTIRRAKYSTLVMLYELHNENRQPLMYTCNVCSTQLETPWHCKQCVEYDLCPQCYDREKHPHPMVQIGLGLNDGIKGQDLDNESATVQESGRDKLSRLVKALGHGCSCRDANCRVYACKTMKINVQHFRVHAASRCNQCSICQLLSVLCYYHSKTCHELQCPVPLCPKLKAKMKQQQKQQRLKQTQMLRRRMATMQRCNSLTPSHQPTPPPPQPYQQLSQPPSNTEFASSPAASSMQLSPFPSSAATSTASFTMASPLSRPSTSLHSPQQSFVHPSASGTPQVPGSMTQQHPKLSINSSVPSSPSMTSPVPSNTTTHCFEPSPSPFMPAQQPGPMTDMDTSVGMQDHSSPAVQPNQSQPRSQPSISSCNPTMFTVSNPQNIRPMHQLERSHSGQFTNSVNASGPSHPMPTQHSHPQMTRQSPGATQQMNHAPASPRYQQFYPTQSSTSSICPEPITSMQFSTAVVPSSCGLSRTASEGHTMSYTYAKQQSPHLVQQRHPSQPPCPMSGDTHTMISNQSHFQNAFPGGNPNWRAATPDLPGSVMYSGGPSISGPNEGGNVCVQMQPNVTVTRSIPSGNLHNCPTPPLGPNTVSPEDVRIVQQTYNTIRQRGAPISEFSNWLNNNPQMLRAWQFIQQQQQQQQQMYTQQQQSQMMASVPQTVGIHLGSMSSQPGVCYPSVPNPVSSQHSCPGRPLPQRHPSHAQSQSLQSQSMPPMMAGSVQGHPSQQWTSVPQARFRPTGHNSIAMSQQQPVPQHQGSYYHQQSGKLGSTGSISCQQQANPSSRYVNQMGPQQPVQQQLQSNQLQMSTPMMRGPGPMGAPVPQLISRCGVGSGGVGNTSMTAGPGSSMGGMITNTNRSSQPAPHYSSVMLSQLLGPGQANSMPSTQVPNSDFMLNSVQQPVNRMDFAAPHPNVMPVNQHYQDTGNM